MRKRQAKNTAGKIAGFSCLLFGFFLISPFFLDEKTGNALFKWATMIFSGVGVVLLFIAGFLLIFEKGEACNSPNKETEK